MTDHFASQLPDRDPAETAEWREALADIVRTDGAYRAGQVLTSTLAHAAQLRLQMPSLTQTPYVNTIGPADEPAYPGDMAVEKRLRQMIRWNAVMMVSRANKKWSGLGGHLSSYASSANLYEVGFNHFFRGPQGDGSSSGQADSGDQIYYQGHVAPGMYARAFLEGRLSEENLEHFRRETGGCGLPSYPHPWLMPKFWQFPTVSMGLGPIAAIYQARFNRYLHNRGLKDTSRSRVWAFLGDGECDEVETTGAIGVASREQLGNLTFVINCNLQRLDGPVRGNSKVIQELESTFRGAGWNVIKVIWGPEWDPLIAADTDGVLSQRLGALVDGQYQKFTVSSGDVIRREMFGPDPRLSALVEHLSDQQIAGLRRGGHCDTKLYPAYLAATQSDRPTCILAKTVKGWTLGGGFEASNVTHQMKKLDAKQIAALRDRLEIPLTDAQLKDAPYFHPGADSPEVQYMLSRREALGGPLPQRRSAQVSLHIPEEGSFAEFDTGSRGTVEVSTTMAFVRLLRSLLRDKHIGKQVVPIVPDEARTFGMDAFFREFGIYAAHGQKYTPVDSDMLLHYHEAQDGQLLEEGITEAGSMASFIAAGTAHATHNTPMVPFYLFYSMFGLQRTGDQVWSAGDARTRGFMLGATAGRTTLHGEGLQHDDGQSQLLAQAVPNLLSYDPAFAYETATIVKDGLRRMLHDNEDVFYYITLYNENYSMPAKPADCDEGILRGLYRFAAAPTAKHSVQLLASGPMVQAALQAQKILLESYGVGAHVYSVTSYGQLYREARHIERHNRLHPLEEARVPYVTQMLPMQRGPVVAVSDWVTELPSLISRFVPGHFVPLGTNGFGRSDTREALRAHFEVDVNSQVVAGLSALAQTGKLPGKVVAEAMQRFEMDPDKTDPMGM
jgi:pyruvate dehydrogenase E1 component